MLKTAIVCMMLFSVGHIPLTFPVYLIYDHAKSADYIALVTLDNPQGNDTRGSVDLIINKTLKTPASFAEVKRIQIQRYLPIPDPKRPQRYVVFGDIDRGELDVFLSLPGTEAVSQYVAGLVNLRNTNALLPYCFNYLNYSQDVIAHDAMTAFWKASDAEIRASASELDPKKLRAWLREPNKSEHQADIYGLLLGFCGTPNDALYIRTLLDQRLAAGHSFRALLIGYIQLDHDAGWKYALERMKETEPPSNRLETYQVISFMLGAPSNAMTPEIRHRVITIMLSQVDVADLIIDLLRKHKIRNYTTQVLSLYMNGSPLLVRSIVRYALQSPDKQSIDFINVLRTKQPELLAEIEEWLKQMEEAMPKK